MNKQTGFTIMELMIVVAIAGILTALAVPSFQNMITNSRLTSQSNEFLSAIQLARAEAIKRNERVTLCRSTNSTNANPTCASAGDWNAGWIVFEDANNNAQRNAGEDIVQKHDPLSGTINLTGDANLNQYISFISNGLSRKVGNSPLSGTLTMQVQSTTRTITLSSMGQAKVSN